MEPGDGQEDHRRPVMAVWGTPTGPRRCPSHRRAASNSSAPSGRSVPAVQARAGVLTGDAAMRLARRARGSRRRSREHGVPDCSPSPRPGRSSSARRPSRRREPGDRLRGRRRADLSGERPRPSPPGGPCTSSPSVAAGSEPRRSKPHSSAATTSCASSELFHATSRERRVARLGHRPGGIGKTPPRLGVPGGTSKGWSRRR